MASAQVVETSVANNSPSRDVLFFDEGKMGKKQHSSHDFIFAIFTLSGRVGRVGGCKACWGGFRGRHYLWQTQVWLKLLLCHLHSLLTPSWNTPPKPTPACFVPTNSTHFPAQRKNGKYLSGSAHKLTIRRSNVHSTDTALEKIKGKLNSSPTPQVNNEKLMYFVLCAWLSHFAGRRGSLCSFLFFRLLRMGVTTFFPELQDIFRVIWSLQLCCNLILTDSIHKWCYWSHNVLYTA